MAQRTQGAKGKAASATKRAGRSASKKKADTQPATSGGLMQTIEKVRDIVPLGSKTLTSLPAKTVASRLTGATPSRPRTLVTASAAAGAAAVVVYRLLRSGD